MQQQYWKTKQAVFKRLGKKEDDCIIASDFELDMKLELYQTIEESFLILMRVLENYQEKLCILAQEENAFGRFLKEGGKYDKTKAGKAMCSAGQALSYSAQQRLTLRIPLVRLYQEVETFQYRAIVDTLQTVEEMEKARHQYRACLMWMKDISEQLDPDTYKKMEKFRKVQSQVRRAKQRFDKLKVDTLQKVDLLSFSRCNLFSQALVSYQNSLLNVSRKISHSSNSVASMTKGYQHYEFSMLKELTEASRKLEEVSSNSENTFEYDNDSALYFDAEYHDDVNKKKQSSNSNEDGLSPNSRFEDSIMQNAFSRGKKTDENSLQSQKTENQDNLFSNMQLKVSKETKNEKLDAPEFSMLLRNCEENDDLDDLMLLEECLNTKPKSPVSNMITDSADKDLLKLDSSNPGLSIFPSHLLNEHAKGNLDFFNSKASDVGASNQSFQLSQNNGQNANLNDQVKDKRSMWFNLFADLDPLSNPDLIGQEKANKDDNC